MSFTSTPYRIPRTILARLAAEEYVRSFWWFVAVVPLFGMVSLVVGSGLIQVIGMFAVLWPLSIPARAVLTGWKAGGFFSDGVSAELRDGKLYIHGQNGKGMVLDADRVRRVVERHGYLLVQFGIGNFVAIPASALGDRKAEFEAQLSCHTAL